MNKKIIPIILIVVITIGVLAWGFWPENEKPGKPISAEIPEDLEISLIIKGGYLPQGHPDTFSTTIYPDGSVFYRESYLRSPKTKKSGKITENELKELIEVFYENDFFSLEPFYYEEWSDAATLTITITIDGKTHSVESYPSDEGPESLGNIRDKIDDIRERAIN